MVQGLFIALAIALVTAVVQPMIVGQYKRVPAFVTGLVAVACLIAALVWDWLPTPAPGSVRAGVESAANDFRWWFGVIVAVWVYQVAMNVLTEIRRNNEIVSLRNDIQSIAAVIERGVLPRHLNKRQQASISGFLAQFPHCNVAFKVAARDQEASGYRADFQQALTKGGWTVSKVDYSDDLQEGVRTHFMRTMAHQQQPEDPKNPQPDRLLQMALGLAGVRIEGGGGSGINVTENLLTIEIGRPRKDTYAMDPPPGLLF